MLLRLSVLLFALFTSACSTPIQPWERGNLARQEMQWVNDSMEFSLSNHINFSKEGSTGGSMVVGGGCGCN